MEESPPLVVEAAKGGFSVVYRGIALYSRVDPRSAPERTAASAEIRPETLYIVPSPLLGYGLETLLGRIPASSAVLALEADSGLAELSAERLSPEVKDHPQFRFLSGASLTYRDIRDLGRFRRCVEISLSFGRKLHGEAYDALLRFVEAEIARYWRNRMTMIHMGRLWTRNIVRNLARLGDVDLRSPQPWDAPVVVCGAGPSLDLACPWLIRERSRVRVLACDTAVGALAARGLAPDAVVCLEGQIHNLKDFLPSGGAEVPLFADITSHPSSFRAVRGPKILTITRFEELMFLDRLEALPLPALRLPPLGSVGVLALRLSRALTDGPVFLAGLDFSYPPGRTHARGATAIRTEELRQSRLYRANAQWRATFAPGTKTTANGERTDSVLSSYAALLCRETADDSRVLDIRASGLDLGLRRISLGGASDFLDQAVGKRTLPPFRIGPAQDGAALSAVAASFLEGERARVLRLLEVLRSAPEELSAVVAECDWIYSWFPDEHRVGKLPGDVRNRLLAEALDWERRFGEALEAS